jgi:hypothetical protein
MVKYSVYVVIVYVLPGAVGAQAENCICGLKDVGCRPIVSLEPNLQGTQLVLRWVYNRPRCHDFYIIRYGIVGQPLQQKDINNPPFVHSFYIDGDKPYVAFAEACAGRALESSSCTGWSAPTYWLPHGPDTCKDGFVWREAFQGDHVCVTPPSRDKAAAENRDAAGNALPGVGSSGPGTCKSPFVWREADRNGPAAPRGKDHVCVVATRRNQVWAENASALGNKAHP